MLSLMLPLEDMGHIDIVRILIGHGADVNAKNERKKGGSYALIDASEQGHIDIVKILIEHGADVNVLLKGHYEVYKSYFSSKSSTDVNSKTIVSQPFIVVDEDTRAGTALISAVLRGYPDIVKVLLENGAKINQVDNSEYTALI